MRVGHKVNRRSFVARVAGGAVFAGSILLPAGTGVSAHPVNDGDPSDRTGDGRNVRRPASDTGTDADPSGAGTRLGHFSDGDRGRGSDPPWHGRNVGDGDIGRGSDPATRLPSFSDGDTGPHADPPRRGRRPDRLGM